MQGSSNTAFQPVFDLSAKFVAVGGRPTSVVRFQPCATCIGRTRYEIAVDLAGYVVAWRLGLHRAGGDNSAVQALRK